MTISSIVASDIIPLKKRGLIQGLVNSARMHAAYDATLTFPVICSLLWLSVLTACFITPAHADESLICSWQWSRSTARRLHCITFRLAMGVLRPSSLLGRCLYLDFQLRALHAAVAAAVIAEVIPAY